MKQTTLLQGAVMAVLVIVIGLSNSSGPASNGNFFTGAPSAGGGTESTCNTCHNSGASNFGTPSVSWTIAATDGGSNVTSYIPGQTYFVTVDVTAPMGTPAAYGFSSVFLTDAMNTQAGTPSSPDANTQLSSGGAGRTYVEHNKRTPGGSWAFQWTAPVMGTGDVNIYSVGNAVNGAQGTGGDSGSPSSTIITLTEDASMPVELTAFDAVAEKTTVKLRWSTAIEENASHFDVERSIDGQNFLKVGTVTSVGNTRDNTTYTFTDPDAPRGDSYYRLRIEDLDGTFAHSPLAQVRVTGEADFRVYPNPAVEMLTLAGEVGNDASVRILDGTGRSVLSRIGGGTLSVADLRPGLYLVEVRQGGERSVQKLIKR